MNDSILEQKLHVFNNYLRFENKASNALLEFNTVDITNELQFLKWLVKYEALHYDLILLHPDTVSNEEMSTGIIKLSEDVNFHFKTALLQNCIGVEYVFDTYYYEKLNKYNTTPKERLEKQTPFDDDIHDTLSLKYHLEKRGVN